MNVLKMKQWSPYIAGALGGLVVVFSVILFDGYIGSTTTFSRFGSIVVSWFEPLENSAFFSAHDGLFSYHTLFNFQTFFVLGIVFGSFFAAKLSGSFLIRHVPKLFEERFGKSKLKRHLFAFSGGFIMIIGARIADGCTSWWGISSGSKLDLAGFSTLAFFFLGAVITQQIFRHIMGK